MPSQGRINSKFGIYSEIICAQDQFLSVPFEFSVSFELILGIQCVIV